MQRQKLSKEKKNMNNIVERVITTKRKKGDNYFEKYLTKVPITFPLSVFLGYCVIFPDLA